MLKLKKYGKKILLAILVGLLCISSAMSIALLEKAKTSGIVFASEPEQKNAVIYKTTGLTASNTESLSTEVALTRGGAELEDGGIVHEGEYIKYNFKLTNKTQANIDNVKLVASIPEGVKYGELKCNFNEIRQPYFYDFNEELTEKIIDIGTIEAGKSKEVFYEVKVKDLAEGEAEKLINTNVSSYIGEEVAQSYELKNVINPADVQLFLGSFTQYGGKQYGLNIKSDTQEEVEVKIHFPQGFKLDFITYMTEEFEDLDKFESQISGGQLVHQQNSENNESKVEYTLEDLKKMIGEEEFNRLQQLEEIEGIDDIKELETLRLEYLLKELNSSSRMEGLTISEDNVLTAKFKANHCYRFFGEVDVSKIERKSDSIYENIIAYAETTENAYMSNENRIDIPCQDVEVSLSSSKEGEKVKYGEEIDYQISIKNIGKTPSEKELEVPSYIYVNVLDFVPDEIEVNSITYNNWQRMIIEEPEDDKKFYFEEEKDITQNIMGKRTDEEGNALANIDLSLTIPQGETAIIKVKATAGFVYEETEVENMITVKSGDMAQDRTSNKVSHIILPYNYENPNVPNVPDEPDDPNKPDKPDVPDNPDNPNKPDTPDTPDVPNNPNRGDNPGDSKEPIRNKICNFKIDKYISKVAVKTASGVKEYQYENEKLAKVEIKAKEINGATVTVDYKIVVTNAGDVAGIVSKISDSLPAGFAISNVSNKSWPRDSKGEYINTSKSNLRIDPGESTTLTISATKQMTSDTVGTYKNQAMIKSAASIAGLQDSNSQDDISSAELIISISTGIYVYITIAILILAILGLIVVYLVKKGKLKIDKFTKTIFLSIMFVTTVFVQVSQAAGTVASAEGGSGPSSIYLTPETAHSWSSDIGTTYCEDGTIFSNEGEWKRQRIDPRKEEVQLEYDNLYIEKTNSQIEMKSSGDNFIYGPFSYAANGYSAIFEYSVYDHSGNKINATVSGDLNLGNNSFYLTIPKSSCKNGISRVRVDMNGKQKVTHHTVTIVKTHYIRTHYEFSGYKEMNMSGHIVNVPTFDKREDQPVCITGQSEKDSWTEYVNQSDYTEWTDINGTLEIEKVDADNTNKKLGGVTFEISGLGQHTTDANGRIYLENIRPGTYSIREISNSNYGYLASSSDIININTVSDNIGVKTGQYRTPVEKNEKQTGNLIIEKTSKESGKPLEDFSFKLKDSKGRYIIAKTGANKESRKQVKEYILLTDMGRTNNVDEATEFITDSKGHIEIYNLLIDTYEIVEVSVGADKREENRYFDVDDNYITWSSNVNSNGTGNGAKVTVTRQKSQDTEKIGGPADKISIKNERKYIDIKGLVWEDMIDGKKAIRNYVYNTKTDETDDTKDRLLGNVTVNLKGITPEGKVYTVTNVKAKTKDGIKVVDGTMDTGDEQSGEEYYGRYEFQNVLIRKLDEYYIEFVYNGLNYQAIDLGEGSYQDLKNGYLAEATGNTSKAIEENVWETKFENNSRTFFNNKYQVISNNKASGDVGDLDMMYDYADHVSTLNLEGNPKYGYSGARFPINYIKDQYLMKPEDEKVEGKETTNTRKAYNGGLDQIKSKQEIREKDIKAIKNVNLGVYERERPDLGITGRYNEETKQYEYGKQLDNVKLKINGYNHIYKYENRAENQGAYQEGFNVGVKFANRRGAQPYTRAIYKADIEFLDELDRSRELEVYLTYKITLNNNSSNLRARINDIVDYYDARYIKEEIKVGTQLSDVADPINPNADKEIRITEFGEAGNGYNKIVINTSKLGYIEPQHACSDYVYVQFKLNREAVVEILCDGDISNIRNGIEAPENKLLKNVAEIKSYSIQDKTGAVYAGIDQNSNPENCTPGDDTTYEDDTDYSPAIKLAVAKNNRTLDGLVFEDKAKVENNIRQGDGKYQSEDIPLKGVEVELQRRNYSKGGVWETIKTTGATGTRVDGTFNFEDFAAGDYQVTYKWENSDNNKHGTSSAHPEILVQNYKATIFDENAHKLEATTYGNEERTEKYYWYRADNRISDAKDNYETRKQIDREISTYRYNTETDNVNGLKTKQMISATPEIPIGVEYDVTATSSLGDEYSYDIKNIDFGIVERPLQNYKLTKNIDHIKLTLQNGQVLVDADVIIKPAGIGNDGRMKYTMGLEGITNFLKPLPRVGSRFITGKSNEAGYPNGSVELEIDNEVIQGATLEITYKVNIENTSELDYANQDFYEHGTNATTNYKGDVVRITPSKVIDYLDKDWAVDEAIPVNAATWKKKDQASLQAGRDSEDEFPVSPDVYTKQGSEISDRVILYTDKLLRDGISLEPLDPTSRTQVKENSLKEYGRNKEDKRLTLVASKVLTTIDSADVVLENETEIIEIQRPGGGIPEENIEGKTLVEETRRDDKLQQRKRIIPGNFVPGSGWQVEPDDDKSETFFITPNTGENLNYVLPISIGVGALVILAVGVILLIIFMRKKEEAE